MAGEYEFGNARLHARRTELLGRAELERMLDRDVDGLLAALARTAWRADVEGAAARAQGMACVLEAARRHLTRLLLDVRRSYTGDARRQIEALFSRWDRRNLVTILRGLAAGRPTDEVTSTLVPAGRLDASTLRALARQGDLRSAIDLLVTWGEPWGRTLLRAWPAWLASHSLAPLEQALVAWQAGATDKLLSTLEEPVAEALLLDQDRTELLVALRLRTGREAGEELVASGDWVVAQDLPGGHLGPGDLWAVVRASSRGDAASALLAHASVQRWEEPLRTWVADGDLERLSDALDRAVHDRLLGWWARGDPLGAGPIVAYVAQAEGEVHDVRWLAAARDTGWSADEIRARLWAR